MSILQKYALKCENDKRNADEAAKNQVLISCLAKKGGKEAAQEIGTAIGVGVVSEVGGPEIGVPITFIYAAARANKIYKAVDAVGNISDISECIDAAYGH